MIRSFVIELIVSMFVWAVSFVSMGALILVYALFLTSNALYHMHAKTRSFILVLWIFADKFVIPRMKLCTKFKTYIVTSMEAEIARRKDYSNNSPDDLVGPTKFSDM